MSKDLNADVSKSMAEATRAWSGFNATLAIFQANVQRFDFAAAEAEREKLHSFLDIHLDAFAAAGKRVEKANG